jgi:bacterial/archaeal transporter family protein
MPWWIYALGAAAAAAFTAVLAKLGVRNVPSNLATALRTSVVLAFAWAIVVGRQEFRSLPGLDRRALFFLAASGLATGASWLAYFKALSLAPASRVAAIDKLSLPFTLVLAALVLGEPFGWRAAVGVALMVAGAVLTVS